MSEDNSPIVFNVKLKKYEPPVFKEAKSGEMFLYGRNANEMYPDKMIDLYEKSPVHKACIDTKHRFVFGGGWVVDSSVMTQGQEAAYRSKINEINRFGESLNDVWGKAGYDYFNNGGCCVEIIYSETRKEWVEQVHIPWGHVRAFKLGEKEDDIVYGYLKDWKGITKYEIAKEKPGWREWKPFGSQKTPGQSELFYYKTDRSLRSGESGVYPIPSFIAAIPWIEVDAKTGVFHLNNISNNWTAGAMLNLNNGEPTPEQKEKIVESLKKHFAGENTEETGGVLINFNKTGVEPPKLERMAAGDQDKLYLQVATFARQNIITTHDVPMSLLNIPLEGIMFDRNTKQTDQEYFNSTYARPTQQIFERIVNHLMKFNKLEPVFRLKTVDVFQANDKVDDNQAKAIRVLNSLPPSLSQKIIDSLTEDEVRSFIGFGAKQASTNTTTTIQEFSSAESFDFTFDVSDTSNTDEDFRSLHMAKTLDVDLLGFDGDMVSFVHKNPSISVEALAVALKKPADKVETRLNTLIEAGVFTGKIGNLKISKLAQAKIKEEDISLDIQVRYFYEGPNDGSTRDWCRKRLEDQPKQGYTFEQVQSLKPNDANYDGNNFNNRGGWWTHKDGTITTYCRHKWVAKTVRVK